MARDSDRWVTPDTIKTALRWVSLLVLVLIGSVTWLASIGRDPTAVLDAIGAVTTSLAALGGLVLQLANRGSITKVERNTAPLAPGGVPLATLPVEAVTDRLGAHGARPPVPPVRRQGTVDT